MPEHALNKNMKAPEAILRNTNEEPYQSMPNVQHLQCT